MKMKDGYICSGGDGERGEVKRALLNVWKS